MFKYFILSLVPLLANQVESHNINRSKKCADKVQLNTNATYGDVQQLATCYNYDFNDVNPCPSKLKEPFSYRYGWGCKLSNKNSNSEQIEKNYTCKTKADLDSWYILLAKNSWFCYKSAKAIN